MPSRGRDATGGSDLSRDSENAAIARLQRLGGDQFVEELAVLFLQDMPVRFVSLHDAMTARDAVVMSRAAHVMKSSSAQLGAERLAGACGALEDAADRADFAAAERWLLTIDTEYATFSAWLAGRVHATAVWRGDIRPNDGRAARTVQATIAVVEDNADNRLLVDAILGDRFELHAYASGAEALTGMAQRIPDLVLLDVSLPGMDGVEVMMRLRRDARWSAIPVVALTAHAMAGDRDRYLAAGFDAYVAKPIVDERDLIDTIERLLARRWRGDPAADASTQDRP